jgi:coenzyme F420-reducing hydrogenase delta subunit
MDKREHAIILLPAGIKQDQSGRWVSTDLSEADDKLGAPGGKLRVYAAMHLLREHDDAILITGGGLGYDVKEGVSVKRPFLAEILMDELRELGVDETRVILEQNSNSTYQEIQEVERLMYEHGLKQLTFISNRYTLPRLETMIAVKFSHLENHATLSFVAAEDVLERVDPQTWTATIREAYASGYLIRRIEREQNGIAQIKDGTYIFR